MRHSLARWVLAVPSLAITACGSSAHDAASSASTPLVATPSHASMFGDVDVTIRGDLAAIGAVASVKVGGVSALDLRPADGAITVHLQGAPDPGVTAIEIEGERGTLRDPSAFVFDPPAGGAPRRWMAFGASLTHGAQSGGVDARSQLAGYASDVARTAGVFLAPPLVVDRLVPPLEPADFAGDCGRKPDIGKIAVSLFETLTDPRTQQMNLALGRKDPTLMTRNPALGGSTVADVIGGMAGPGHLIERVDELPDGDPTSPWTPITHAQLDRLRAFDADVGFSADLLANDAMPAVTASDDVHPEAATDPSVLKPQIDQVVFTLGALHGQYFVANLLDVTLLPSLADLRASRIAGGYDTNATFDAKLAAVRTVIAAYNDHLARAAAAFPNVHVVDLATEATRILNDGVTIDGVHLTGAKFGGLLSLDHMHFSNTGYALLANLFVRAINAALGTTVPEVDLVAVARADPFSPRNLRAAGVACP